MVGFPNSETRMIVFFALVSSFFVSSSMTYCERCENLFTICDKLHLREMVCITFFLQPLCRIEDDVIEVNIMATLTTLEFEGKVGIISESSILSSWSDFIFGGIFFFEISYDQRIGLKKGTYFKTCFCSLS